MQLKKNSLCVYFSLYTCKIHQIYAKTLRKNKKVVFNSTDILAKKKKKHHIAKANVFGIRRQEKQWIDERQSIAWPRPMLVEYLHVSNEQPLTVKKK